MAAGTVYLKTDRFEVKLEGITFKVRDFEPLCTMDFLFPKGKVWPHAPVVGLDVMRHPRDPSVGLLLLSFGIGCVILRFRLGEELPDTILKFLKDQRISFVGFGIPEKKDLFPFDKLGLEESKVDVGFLAAKLLNDPKLKKCELADLARRVIGIKKMVGLTEAGTLGRHQQIKCAICEVFVSSVIAMTLLDPKNESKFVNSAKKNLISKNLEPPSLSTEGWSKMLTSNHNEPQIKQPVNNDDDDVCVEAEGKEDTADADADADAGAGAGYDFFGKGAVSPTKKPLKGILKCPSSNSFFYQVFSSPPTPKEQMGSHLKRANSKGHNVSFGANNTVRI